MATHTDEAFQIVEDAYLKAISKPKIDLDIEEANQRAEVVHNMSLKMMKMEAANLSELQAAFDVEGEKMALALETLDEATKANTDYLTMLYSMDYALQIMHSFFNLLQ